MATSFRNAGGDRPVVRTTKFGNLGRAQLSSLRFNRLDFNEFLKTFADGLAAAKQSTFNISRVIQVIGPATDEAVFHKWLFAREAEAMGIAVDEKTFNDFLGEADQQSSVARTSSMF